MYLKRTLEKTVKETSLAFPVLLVTGPRQVGKTTLLKNLCEEKRTYVTLDDPNNVKLAKEDPLLFFQRFKPPILIDEIQYAPELLPIIKIIVDESKIKGLFWLTGSQQFHLMKGVSESLAGRIGIIRLLGFSQKELSKNPSDSNPFIPSSTSKLYVPKDLNALENVFFTAWKGSFPAMWSDSSEASKPNRDIFYSSYIQTYLQRDVRDLANIENTTSFLKFLQSTAARTGQLLNMTDIARDADISPNTAKNWLSILEASGIIFLLQPYHNNLTKRLVKTPKLYFLDTGLCSYLTEWSSHKTLEAGAMSGAIFETYAFIEILKSYWHNGKRIPIYYYRDKDKKEIDLLLVKDGCIYPIEIKKSASPGKEDVKNFKTLEKLGKPIGEGCVISLVDTHRPITKSNTAIPVASI